MGSASYLLNASSEEMAAWKEAAAKEGVALAQWLREAANAKLEQAPATEALTLELKDWTGH